MAGTGALPVGGFHAEAVEQIDDRKTTGGLGGVGRREIHEHGLLDGITEGIFIESVGVEGGALESGVAGGRGGGLGAEGSEDRRNEDERKDGRADGEAGCEAECGGGHGRP